mgnify:CR=1 FL=1
MKKRILISLLFAVIVLSLSAQVTKKPIDHDAIEKWNRITQTVISDNGKYISYKVEPWRGDSDIYLYSSKGELEKKFECSTAIDFSRDSEFLVFKTVPSFEIIRELKLKKTKKDDMPGDKLRIYNIGDKTVFELADIVDYKLPDKWSGYIAYQAKVTASDSDSDKSAGESDGDEAAIKEKKESAKNGYRLVLRNLHDGEDVSWPFVKNFMFARDKEVLLFVSGGDNNGFAAGLYRYDIESKDLFALNENKGDYKQVMINDDGASGAFLLKADGDDKDYELFAWKGNNAAEKKISNESEGITDGWILSENESLVFSEDMTKLFFGTAPDQPEKDTMRLDDEYPNVDIWHGTEGEMHTVQVINKNRDLRKAYLACYNIESGSISQLETPEIPDVSILNKGDCEYALGLSNVPYELQSMWESSPLHYDVYLINTADGERTLIKKDIRASVQPSPGGKYLLWYNYPDASYYSYSIATGMEYRLTTPETVAVANELNDVPNYASPYYPTGWLENDEALLINDRYDIWRIDPENKSVPLNITRNGRSTHTTYTRVQFDREERSIKKDDQMLLSGHNDITRESSYYTFKIDGSSAPEKLIGGPYSLSRPQKAADANTVVYSKSTFKMFPDLLVSDLKFRKSTKISNANPQQAEYLWGSAEIYSWTSLDGRKLQGLLYKPENFDPAKKYPMIVNFYEKSSQGLYNHRVPELGRSTIGYHYYTSNGYVIFNPDVYYEDGYPGESAFNCVMPGITSLIEEGFIDSEKIGAQGHSWGGYQVAYLATRTDLFAAIESGAPVVNMFSAYGGIRWWSGLNRSFQYEHTQSRIGATIWEAPLKYLENSPLFTMDKVTTPILIMANDADGHVPWYQGIEYFVALRRLQKPVWMLNYTGEPHWPQQFKNKKDFQLRMSQFFNHYLKDAPQPRWMKEGVPAIKKDFDLGYELIKE